MTALNQALLAAAARQAGQRREVIADGIKTVYWFYPAKSAKPKGDIVFFHGYRGNHHGLEAIVGALQSVNVYMPDLPGFGQSEPLRDNHSIENYKAWIGAFLKELKFKEKPHLLGHSFGSILISAFAAGNDSMATLILENPVATQDRSGFKALTLGATSLFFGLAGLLPARMGEFLLKAWPMVRIMSVVTAKTRDKALRKWIHGQHDDNFNDFASRSVALEGYYASISDSVGQYANAFVVPVLALVGDNDEISTVEQQREMFARIETKATMHVFENVGHLTHYEIPEKIAGAIEDWIADNG